MKKILIVEDDQIVANIYRNRFSVDGYTVEIAPDGLAGLEMVRSFRPDAVILDLMLPKMTGVDLMKKIRSEPDFQQVPVVVFSNTYLSNMVQEAWKAGATKCLSKANCTPKHVTDVLRGLLGNGASTAPASEIAKSSSHVPANGAAGHPAENVDAQFQADLRKSFVDGLPATLVTLRQMLQVVIKSDNDEARIKQLQELSRRVHGVSANAGITGLLDIARMADAVEALLKDLHDKPKNINPSTLRTTASAVDFLGILFERDLSRATPETVPGDILVVDDEAISRRAVSFALEKAKLKCTSLEDPVAALALLSEKDFDLIFLDVDMPGMNGFELCSKLRTLPVHKKTPVVFVTSLTDFESRASSTMSGGNDLIAKPFLFMELAVKALVYTLRKRLQL